MIATWSNTLLQRRGMRQLIKFCIVGATSTVVDLGILALLLTLTPTTPWWVCKSVAFCLAVTNGFIWNRRWTFQAGEHGSVHSQYPKFVLTNAVGLLLNLAIMKLFLILLTGQLLHGQNPEKWKVIAASLCAVPFVVIWNFTAAKYWTFRAPKPPRS
ncbi:MAG: GtrA family protein [Armatimonadota bacterium]|nr:GtrA family protein [Armatimonadota bacterium]